MCCRFIDGEKISEDLLTLIGLEGMTTGEAIYNALVKRFSDLEIPMRKCISVTTDGAPAMVGKQQGVVARLKTDMPSMLAFHCIIHQTVLCGKLSAIFQQLMTNAMKMINFLKSQSALRHRNLRKFLNEANAEYDDLLTHNNVRWLSKGNALFRIWKVREELLSFLNTCTSSNAQPFKEMMSSTEDMCDLAFLVDICGHLNKLNLKLQGREKTIVDLLVAVQSFEHQLELFATDIQADMLQFITLKTFIDDIDVEDIGFTTNGYVQFIEGLTQEFNKRFSQFQSLKHLVQLIKAPQKAKPNGEWMAELPTLQTDVSASTIQLELCNMKGADIQNINDTFWLEATTEAEYPHLTKLAKLLLTIFASTYICESAFSNMNHIKNKLRSTLTQDHLDQLLRVACSNREPDYKNMLDTYKQFHSSH